MKFQTPDAAELNAGKQLQNKSNEIISNSLF